MKKTIRNHRQSQSRHIAWLFIISLFCLTYAASAVHAEISAGDADENGIFKIGDAIAALQIAVNANVVSIHIEGDVNGNERIGIEEAIYALRGAAGLLPEVVESADQNRVGPSPRHATLQAVDGCTTLLDDFKQSAIAEMEKRITENLNYAIQWGGCWYPPMYAMDMEDGASTGGAPMEKGASEYSETNTQVDGVDEADFVKNDGSHIYILADGKFHIIDAWPPEQAHILSSSEIEGQPEKMFIHNNRAFVYSSLDYMTQPHNDYYGPYYDSGECTYGYNCEFTGNGRELKITVLDISDMTAPSRIREISFSGSYLNSRRIGDAVHTMLVFPEPWVEGIEYWPREFQNCWGYYWEEDWSDHTEEELRAI